MKVSLNWLKQYVDIDMSVDELVQKIGAQLGAVEEVIDLGKKYQGIVIAKVVECQKHPNADKLSLCKIDDGGKTKDVERDKDGLVQVVCGAPNVKAGMLVAWLPPGTTVPASYDKDPFVLSARELRGKLSNGMLASASELDLSDDHDGILEVLYGEVGDSFAEAVELNDHIIDIENKMFTHRPDCFGMLGVAREIAGITNQQFKSPGRYLELDTHLKANSKLPLTVENKISKLVPRFSARVIENIVIKPSSEKIQADLMKIGTKSVNNIVDITNWIMHDTAQPMHAYDYDKLCKVAGTKTATLETRLSRKGDKLELLNGKTIKFDDNETILITSNDVPVGIGGVMGGANTEVDENTKNIVLECANFDMYAIRRASMRHGLFTDAVTRFNKGQSPLQIPTVMQLATGFMLIVGGQDAKTGKVVDEHSKLNKPIAVHVTAKFINERLGLKLSVKDIRTLLENVEFGTTTNGPTLVITPPFWRMDIEIPEDIVEEVGRLYGFDHLPLELPSRTVKPPAKNLLLTLKQGVRSALSAAGANELLTYNFVHGDLLEKVGQSTKYAYKLSNALSPDLQYFRTSLTPSLLDKVHMNIKAGHASFALFEINKAHYKGKMDKNEPDVPNEDNRVSLVFASAKSKPGQAAFYMARTYLEQIAPDVVKNLVLMDNYSFADDEQARQLSAPYDPKRSALVVKDNKVCGVIGEFNSSVRRSLKLPTYCAGFEINIETLQDELSSKYTQLSRYPVVSQDISLRLPATISFGQLESFLQNNLDAPEHTWHELEPIDIYQSEKDKNHKNMTFRLTMASYQKTLKAGEVNKLLDELASKAKKTLKAERL